ncbi:MAG: nucleotide exchange factor GrpE [Pseudohongiellaceae bacterium]
MSKQTPDQQGAEDEKSQTAAATEEMVTEQDPEQEQAAESEPGAAAAEVDELEQALEAAQRAKDDLLRVQAEMQNLRRRTEQDIEKAHKYGQEKFSIELLGVMDNLERSLEAASNSEDETIKAIYEGVNLTLKSFADCFAKFNIEAVDPLGEPFDPQLHQAMSIQENADAEPNTVIAVMQKGYTLHGRVIRPAMVMVSK